MTAPAEAVPGGMRRLAAGDLVGGTTGNLSVRVDGAMCITRTRNRWRDASPADLVDVVLADGAFDPLGPAPSIEAPLHRAVYAARPDVGAIVHTHSVHAVAWSLLDAPMLPEIADLAYYAIGTVRTLRGSGEDPPPIVDALGTAGAVLLAGHGVVAVGATVDAAIDVAEAAEHHARVCWLLR